MLVNPFMYSPAARPSSARAAPAKKRKQSAMGGISSLMVTPSGLPTFSDSMRASSSPCSSMTVASLSSISLRSRGVLSDQTSSYALRAAFTAWSTSSAVPFGTVAMTSPRAGFLTSCTSLPVLSTHWPPMNIWWRRSAVFICLSLCPPCLERYGGRHLGKGGAQDVQSFVELLVRNGQRHQRADHVVVHARTHEDQSFLARHRQHARGLLVGRLFGLAAAHQLHAGHRAHHAHVADDLMLIRPAAHPLLDHGAYPRGALGQPLVAHDVEHGEAGGARDRVACVRAAEAARRLATVMRSGSTPECSMAKNLPVRPKPVWISSTMSTIPCFSVTARRPWRNSRGAGTKPPSPSTGSMMIAATRSAGTSEANRSSSTASAAAEFQPRYSYGNGVW